MALIKSCLAGAGGAGLTTVSTHDVANNNDLTLTASVGDIITISGTGIGDNSNITVRFGTLVGANAIDRLEQTAISSIIIEATATSITVPITGAAYNRITVCK